MALRTLRQVPKAVGETDAGDPIYEVRSVRLVLRGNAAHFNRMVACSRCGREVPGPPVMSATDLAQQPQAVICQRCVSTAHSPIFGNHSTPTPPPAKDVRREAVRPPTSARRAAAEGDRLAALERRLAEMASVLHAQRIESQAALAQRHRTQADLAGVDEGTREMERTLAAVVEQLKRDTSAVEQTMEQAVEGLAERLQAQFSAALQAGVEGLHATIEQAQADAGAAVLDQATAAMAAIEAQLTQRLDRLAEEAARRAEADAHRLAALDPRIEAAVKGAEERETELRGLLEARIAQLEASLEGERERAGVSLASLGAGDEDLRLAQEELRRLLTTVVDRQEELQAEVEAGKAKAEAGSATLSEAIAELGAVERRLSRRIEDATGEAARRAEAEHGRLAAVEPRIDEAVAGAQEGRRELRALLEARLAELEAALEARIEGLGAHAAQLRAGDDELRQTQGELRQVLEGVVDRQQGLHAQVEAETARAETRAGGLEQALADVERHVRETLHRDEEGLSQLRAVMEARVAALEAAVGAEADRVEGYIDRSSLGNQELRRAQEELGQLLRSVVESQRRLQEDLESGTSLDQVRDELTRVEHQVNGRLERFLERASRPPEPDGLAVESVLDELRRSMDQHEHNLAALRDDLERALDARVADVHSAVKATSAKEASRLRKLEARATRHDVEMSELQELLATLDGGLGGLRAELATLRRGGREPSGAFPLGRMRSDVNAVQVQLEAHDEALATLTRAVERLRRKVAAPAPAKTPRKATKD